MFGKKKADLDLAGESLRVAANENPLAYVYNVLNYLKVTRPNATEPEKVDKLYDYLPLALKAEFVNNVSQSVAAFAEKLKNINRKLAFRQAAFLQQSGITLPVGNAFGALTQYLESNPQSAPSGSHTFATLPIQKKLVSQLEAVVQAANQSGQMTQFDEKLAKLSADVEALRLASQVERAKDSRTAGNFPKNRSNDKRPTCFNCGKQGHIRKDCWGNPANAANGNPRFKPRFPGAGQGQVLRFVSNQGQAPRMPVANLNQSSVAGKPTTTFRPVLAAMDGEVYGQEDTSQGTYMYVIDNDQSTWVNQSSTGNEK